MKIKVKKLHPDAKIPQYATDGSACFDLHSIQSGSTSCGAEMFSTGLSFEIPAGHVMLCFSRSGHGFKNDVRLSNYVGVIDSDYRGEVTVKLRRETYSVGLTIAVGDRIAQALIIPIPTIEFVEADELSDTTRGTGGHGSTGK